MWATSGAQPVGACGVQRPMRLQTVQIVAGLSAAVALVLAFIAAGVGLAAGLFALLIAGVLEWAGWKAVRRGLTRGVGSRSNVSARRPG